MIAINKIISLSFIRVFVLLLASTILLSACQSKKKQEEKALCKGVSAQEYIDMNVPVNDCTAYKAAQQRECWQAGVLNIMYVAMGTITMDAYKKLTQGAMAAMMVLFSVWFAYSMLKYMGSIKEEESPGAFWTGVLKKFFLCFICGYLASSTNGLIFVLNYLIYPIFNAFLELASYLLAEVAKETTASEITFMGDVYEPSQQVCQVSDQIKNQASDSQFPEGANQMMQCLVCNVSDKLNIGFMLSLKIMSLGLLIPQIIGITILAIFTFVKLGFVFYLVETVFRFTMMVVMMPIFIMGFAFEKTRSWMIHAFKIILAGGAYVLAISVVISLSIIAIVQMIVEQKELLDSSVISWVEFSPAVFTFLMIAFLVKKTMDVAAKISNMMVSSKITSKFAELLGGFLKLTIYAIGSIATLGAASPYFAKLEKINMIIKRIKQAKEKVDEIKEKMKKLAGNDEEDE